MIQSGLRDPVVRYSEHGTSLRTYLSDGCLCWYFCVVCFNAMLFSATDGAIARQTSTCSFSFAFSRSQIAVALLLKLFSLLHSVASRRQIRSCCKSVEPIIVFFIQRSLSSTSVYLHAPCVLRVSRCGSLWVHGTTSNSRCELCVRL
jgi:hypothetical protein